MDILNLLFDHYIQVIIFLLLFGGSIGGALRWLIHRSFQHRERMQEKRNEELRLLLQLKNAEEKRPKMNNSPASASRPLPKDMPWDDQTQTTYEQGYQQQMYEEQS